MVINTLKNVYNFTHFTWWDLFRRLKLKDYAGLQREMTSELLKALETGVITDGANISMVLSGPKESNTGLRDPNDDTLYLTEEQRITLLADGTISEDIVYLNESDRTG